MNDWYIDRSVSICESNLQELLREIARITDVNDPKQLVTNTLATMLVSKGFSANISAGNPAASLGRLRDHGFTRLDNSIGDPARFFIEDKLELGELVIDTLIKRPSRKTNPPKAKPLVMICKLFDAMFQMDIDPDDVYLTYAECKEYLFPCDDYASVNYDLVERILRERQFGTDGKQIERVQLVDNEGTGFGIWFNALRESAVFLPSVDNSTRKVLRPNRKQKEFFRFVSENADEFAETPTAQNKELFDFFCDGKTGLLEVITDVIKPNAPAPRGDETRVLFEYLFGYKKRKGFDYLKFFKNDCFGAYFPFIAVPRIPIRKIYYSNKQVGDALFEYANNSGHYYKLLENDETEFQRTKKQKEERFMLIERAPRTVGDKKHPLNQIFYGAPGTGKTYLTVEYALAILEGRDANLSIATADERKAAMVKFNKHIGDGKVRLTAFHHNYGYSDFINKGGIFYNLAQLAMNDKTGKYVLIIDEINRGNITKIFGELITLIEDDKRWGEPNALQVVLATGEAFAVPNNLYIIGTMSTADKSASLLDAALRRRFKFIENKPNYELVTDEKLRATLQHLNDLLVKALESTDLLIGHAYFMDKTGEQLASIMNESIVPLLYEYFYEDSKRVYTILKETLKDTSCKPEHSATGRISIVSE